MRQQRLQIATLCATAFFGMVGGAMVSPTLPAIMEYFSVSATTGVGSAAAPFIGGMLAGILWRVPFFLYFLTVPLALFVMAFIPEKRDRRDARHISSYVRVLTSAPNRMRIFGIMGLGLLSFVLLYSLIIYIPLLLIFFSRSVWQIVASLLLFGSGFGSVQPQLNTWITEQVEGAQRGGVVSLFNMTKYIGQTTAPLAFGAILAAASVETIFLVAAGIGFFTILLAFNLKYTRAPA